MNYKHRAFTNAIFSGLVCPYCHKSSVFMDSKAIYKKQSHGMVYACLPCKAWVGVHKGTDKALGRLANERLRQLKIQAHDYFDPIWKRIIEGGLSNKHKARNKAYCWLAKEMGIERQFCHIGYFNEDQCEKAIKIILDWEEKYPNFFL